MSEKELTKLIILGAGASVDCGFYPTGAQFIEIAEKILLAKELVANNSLGESESFKNFSPEKIREPLKKLISARPTSIDAYISGIKSPQEQQILKSLIVSILRVCTTYSEHYADKFQNNWYFSIWQLIEVKLRECSCDAQKLEKLENFNSLKIITFNYDISLELFLWKRIKDNLVHDLEQKKALKIISEKIITHVYGSIESCDQIPSHEGHYNNHGGLEFEALGYEFQTSHLTIAAALGRSDFNNRVIQLLTKILAKLKVEEVPALQNEKHATDLIGRIDIIGHERAETKKEIAELANPGKTWDFLYVLGYGFDHANNDLLGLEKIEWQKGCFVTNYASDETKVNQRLDRLILDDLLSCNQGRSSNVAPKEYHIPLISHKSVSRALKEDFSLFENPRSPLTVRTLLTPYLELKRT